MDDTIYRQAAIDAIRSMQTYKMFAGDDLLLVDQAGAQTELMLLPSAQPEIIRCKDCKCWDFPGYCVDFMTQDGNGFCSWAERRE